MGFASTLWAGMFALLPVKLGSVAAGLLTYLLVAAPVVAAATPDPALAELTSDPAPDAITNDRHYLISNERRLDLFTPEVQERGNVYVGVGAGQNYLLAGWARPSHMVLIDFDQDVVDLHQIYIALLSYAGTPAAFEALFSAEQADVAHAVLAIAAGQRHRATRLLALYERARPKVQRHLRVMRGKLEEAGVAGYLTDDDAYDHVATLARSGRIIARRGDFTTRGVVADVGRALEESGKSIGVLYLSNIEQYFMYRKPFRANMLGLPLASDSVVLRTLPARPAGFEYIVQTGPNFEAWMNAPRVYSVYGIRKIPSDGHLIASHKHVVSDAPKKKRPASSR